MTMDKLNRIEDKLDKALMNLRNCVDEEENENYYANKKSSLITPLYLGAALLCVVILVATYVDKNHSPFWDLPIFRYAISALSVFFIILFIKRRINAFD